MLSFRVCTPRFDRVVAIAAMSATLVATCASPSFARHHHNATVSNTATTVTSTVSPAGTVQTTVTTATVPIDYTILANGDFRYFDLRRAQAFGLTDYQIAQAAKLAHYADVPMNEVLNDLQAGATMNQVAWQYGVPINDLDDVSDWQDRIHDYMLAYRNTGVGALRHGPAQPSIASYSSGTVIAPVGGSIAPNGAAVTPNGTTVAPNGTTVMPNGTTVAPNGTTVTPNGTTVAPNGTTVSPGDDTGTATPSTAAPVGGTEPGTTVAPNGTTVTPNGTTTAPNGTTVTPNGTTVAPNGTTVAPNGTTTP